MLNKIECYRCGKCSRSFLATIPKYEESNLSPVFLDNLREKYGEEFVLEYIEENSEFQEKRCKWLIDESNGTTSCSAYERRSSECIDFPEYRTSVRCLTREN